MFGTDSSFLAHFLADYASVEDLVDIRNTKLQHNAHNKRLTDMTLLYIGSSRQLMKSEIEERPFLKFCTGSMYCGEWDQFGMSGEGVYTFMNGICYQGALREGQFNGHGKLIYPNGAEIHAIWKNGRAYHVKLIFGDALQYMPHTWKYCKFPDRRFLKCIQDSIRPVGESNITPDKPERKIPKGCYDTIDGIFNPKYNIVYNPNTRRIIRIPTKRECEWIIENCRRGTFIKIPQHRKPVRLESTYNFEEKSKHDTDTDYGTQTVFWNPRSYAKNKK